MFLLHWDKTKCISSISAFTCPHTISNNYTNLSTNRYQSKVISVCPVVVQMGNLSSNTIGFGNFFLNLPGGMVADNFYGLPPHLLV